MSRLTPLLMTPIFDPRPWGTLDLSPIYPNQKFTEKIGEAWLTGDHCKVASGPLAGRSLEELAREYGRELVGASAPSGDRFPLLLKFLFPHEKLSVQVHPDDEAARRIGQPCGKTECWYVAHAKPGAQIGLGLKAGVTREDFKRSIEEKKAEELLNWVNVYSGDMIYVAAGTVHTLGPGAVIVETQQQSDTTYRLYDYGRPRELHLEQGLAVIKEKVASGKVLRPAATTLNGGKSTCAPLIAAPCFRVDRLNLREAHRFPTSGASGESAVQILTVVDGCAVIQAANSAPITVTKGDAAVIPGSVEEFTVQPQWTVEFLKSWVPGRAVPEPTTRM